MLTHPNVRPGLTLPHADRVARSLADRPQPIVGPLQIGHFIGVDAHDPATGRIDRSKIPTHYEHTGLFRIAHDRPIALHPDNAIDNGKVRFQGCIDVEN